MRGIDVRRAGYVPPRPAVRLVLTAREEGAIRVARKCLGWAMRYAFGLPLSFFPTRKTLGIDGAVYRHFHHRHRYTWLNERAVELPYIHSLVERHRGKRVLEVGNVLRHYFDCDHRVVDKYERGEGVVNRDVLDLDDSRSFDLIVSISTLEHVGVDEEPRDPVRAVRAVSTLQGLLAPGGSLVFTVPVGYNPELDAAIRSGHIDLARLVVLKRVTAGNRWQQVDPTEVWDLRYDFLLYTAHAVLICTMSAPPA